MKGKLISGDDAPAMRVEKTGLYHIVLDINKLGDLDKVGGAQILLLDASDFGVRGAMNGWGFTSADPAVTNFSNDGIAFTFKDQKLGKNGEFKFATGNYWKVTLDDAGKVKAEVSLAAGMTLNGDNISVDKSGKYDITLNFKLAGGSFDKSFSYTTNMTEALPDYPDYIEIRGNYNNHEWGADKLKLGAKQGEAGSGVYKAIVTMMGGTEFKFVVDGGTYYGGSFTDLTTSGANMKLDEEGTYYVEVDIKSDTKTAKFEKVTRVGVIGNALTTGWDSDQELSFDAAKNVFSGDIEFLAGSDVSFKIRFNNAWDWSYGGAVDALVFDGANFPTPGAGTYNVVADFANTANLTLTKK